MKAVSGRAFCKLLEQNGWLLARIKGSHYIYKKSGERAHITVPVHKNKALKIGLQRKLMRVAGITEDEL